MSSQIVIPARLASTRLPEKLLLRAAGKSVLQHTYESARKALLPQGITVAVDHERLFREVESFGGQAMMTDVNAQSGTDRVAEVAAKMPDIEIFVNVQGDEPEIEGKAIDQVIQLLQDNPQAAVATLATPIRSLQDLEDPSCVKVVTDVRSRALYFSRCPIPYDRSAAIDWSHADPIPGQGIKDLRSPYLQHLGIYAYRRDFLSRLSELPPSALEQLEKLEQLRFLQAGCEIVVGRVQTRTRGIDTEADYQAFVSRQKQC